MYIRLLAQRLLSNFFTTRHASVSDLVADSVVENLIWRDLCCSFDRIYCCGKMKGTAYFFSQFRIFHATPYIGPMTLVKSQG